MADFIFTHSYLILFFPLLSFLVISFWMNRTIPHFTGLFSIGMAMLSMISGLLVTAAYYTTVLSNATAYPKSTIVCFNYSWLNFSPELTANMGLYLDPISMMMVMVITVISFLVNIYSVGYMRNDPGFGRFFALLSLFSFSMLGLVVSSNILQMFVFWELVGVSSYTLIGFWYDKPSAVAASKKAFIITRFADAFFLLGILMVSYHVGSFDFLTLNTPAAAAKLNHSFVIGSISINLLTLSTLLIFAGGWGKSAMFPLHVWLPDAMEGPTPVSSIIHSATMVVAGVYLTARIFPLFSYATGTLTLIQFIGAFTALFAAIIAITQRDIKRILAFSTLSQLGYMLFSLGAAKIISPEIYSNDLNPLAYSAAMYHVFTHAFFKCMLFLGAGSIIHAVHTNDIMDLGGLKSVMPKTHWSLLAACLAIAGLFPLSGFWSKDLILLAALQSGHFITFTVGLVTGCLTSFYMFRFFFLIFYGKARSKYHKVHEDPWMSIPILILTIPTICAGILEHFFINQITAPGTSTQTHLSHPGWLPYLASAATLSGIYFAWILYGKGSLENAQKIQRYFNTTHRIVFNKFYIDQIYLLITHRIIFGCIATPVKWIDRHIVDGIINLCGEIIQLGGRAVRFIQNGQLQLYLGITVLGLIGLIFLGK